MPTSPFYSNGTPAAPQSGPCHALLVSNPWAKPAQLSLSRGGDDYDVDDFTRIPSGIGPDTDYGALPASGIPSGQVAVVFLSHRPGVNNGGTSLECPIEPAVLEDTAAQDGAQNGINAHEAPAGSKLLVDEWIDIALAAHHALQDVGEERLVLAGHLDLADQLRVIFAEAIDLPLFRGLASRELLRRSGRGARQAGEDCTETDQGCHHVAVECGARANRVDEQRPAGC